ncbi:MAG: hypothetical protein E6G05_13170 [Actinobacteria bacterium]|nr:MAG: hypothetical protein E6G05_13170 [Actinomycetota bacterium]
MANKRQPKAAVPYVRRMLEDDYLQEQLRDAASALYATYARARKQRASAAEDKRLYRSLRQAATAVRNAATALRPPQPEPKRPFRKLAVVALAGGATVWLTMKLQKNQSQGTSDLGAQDSDAAETSATVRGVPDQDPAAAHTA